MVSRAGSPADNRRRRPRGSACKAVDAFAGKRGLGDGGQQGGLHLVGQEIGEHAAALADLGIASREDQAGLQGLQMADEGRQDIGVARLLQHGESSKAHAEIIRQRWLLGIAGMDGMEPDRGAETQRQLQGAGVEIGAPAPPRGGMTPDGEQDGDIKRHRDL